jgi:hypothetical protein
MGAVQTGDSAEAAFKVDIVEIWGRDTIHPAILPDWRNVNMTRQNHKEQAMILAILLGTGVGAGVGAALAVALHSTALGVSLGAAIGVSIVCVFAFAFGKRQSPPPT